MQQGSVSSAHASHVCPASSCRPLWRRTVYRRTSLPACAAARQDNPSGLAGWCTLRQSQHSRCPSRRATHQVTMSQATAAGEPESSTGPSGNGSLFGGLTWGAGALILCAAGWAVLQNAGYSALLKDWAANSALNKSEFLAAFALIFLSEIGDKTFFIAGLLAMKMGRMISFVGSTMALAIMTVISVVIGYGFKSVPDALKSSIPVGHYLSVACLLYFGVKTLKDAWQTPSTAEAAEGGELASAQESLEEAEKSGSLVKRMSMQSLLQVGSIIFLAEWGDRSMLATVALGASHSPLGVATGAILGHAVATLIAVTGAALASSYISERMLGFVSGGLFLVFAALTILGIF